MYFKAPDNTLHCIDLEFAHLLPPGSVQITDEEAEVMRQKPDRAVIFSSKLAYVRQSREVILNRLAGIAFAAKETGDQATVDAYIGARKGLLDMTKDLPEDDAEGAEMLLFGRYQAVLSTVQLTAPVLITAFSGVDGI